MICKLRKSKWASNLLALVLITCIGLTSLTGCGASTNKEPSSSATAKTNENKETYYGDWVIKKVLAYGSVGTYFELVRI